jgi:RsiW-degrading membrane proteinase PrsW (M82 family)
MIDSKTILLAGLAGIGPALVWLFFWLREDSKRAEPKRAIARTFFLGMLAVVVVIPLEKKVDASYPGLGLTAFVLWALIEEALKFSAAYIGGLSTRDDDEPLDPMIYMITAALGFVALENALFLATPLLSHDFMTTVVTGNLRFMGASVLHIVTSGLVGFAISLSFYKGVWSKILYGLIGMGFAVAFHTGFNIMILNQESIGSFAAFGAVWGGAMALLLLFDKAKAIATTS